ncbi:vanillate O-demethylase ferredoxin subunit [Kribbella antiqua]|uniref:Vanillate O-demethylase ferredoxin subunit n=1 Tax=Kribbella antiqua TaxID=2512217 RepID=A0A4R2J0R3_9ACTN|nr:PDR/VanB family oxidoreductase [Kribbella antiqua]TCO50298.1 vanillate O-demethylase ferredoxin subunit [Kribbella antiqua]
MAAQSTLVWQTGEIVEASDAADGIRRLVIRPERPAVAPPGSHVDVEVNGLRRSYSVVRCEDGQWTLSVRLAADSRGGSQAMHALRTGDRLRISDPLQNFPLGVGATRYVLLAGGIGITALLAMGATLKRRGEDYTFVYVGRSRPAMAWLRELEEDHGDRLKVHVDDEGTGLDVGAVLNEIGADTELYMCGPIRLMDAVRREWVRRALSPTSLRFETFGNSGAWAAEEFTVSIPGDGRTITVPTNLSMLEALEEAGVEVMWDCRKGECGLCVVRVHEYAGRIDHRDVFLGEAQKTSRICLCVSRVASDGATHPQLVIDRP